MNYKRWSEVHSDEMYMAKLGEEFGEVARAQSNRLKSLKTSNPVKRGIKAQTYNLIEELEHVEFIAQCWRRQLQMRTP